MSNAIYWFTNDLRLTDNAALNNAVTSEKRLDFIYCVDPSLMLANRYTCKGLGKYRYRFLLESLCELNNELEKYGQHLKIYYDKPHNVIEHLYNTHNVRRIYHSIHAGFDEKRLYQAIAKRFDGLELSAAHTHTIFEPKHLPFSINDLPDTFSKFRRWIEGANEDKQNPANDLINSIINKIVAAPKQLPEPLSKPQIKSLANDLPEATSGSDPFFNGGLVSAQKHLTQYFNNPFAQTYKQTRNTLDDWNHSTKFSAWLANGCISPKQIVEALQKHERQYGANDSTYWILFELYWREYFQWYAHKYESKLFAFTGINSKKPMTSFYSERFQRWKNGNTPYPIVNACMKQLNATGYMSNRGRQLAASCLIHELELDWRYGAAYFEQQLIDYDVAANWGNWQYLADVGADPRGCRRFNLEKQTQTYDPDGTFIHSWNGYATSNTIDSIDAADWPISLND